MPHINLHIFYSCCTKCNSKWLLVRDRQRSWAHGRATENWIAFEILSAVRLPWWVDAIVNLFGFYVAVVFLWRFRLRVATLSLSPALRDAIENLEKKCFTREFFYRGTLNRLKERGNIPDLMTFLYVVERKRFVGRRSLDSPSLLCFMNQRMKTKETENKTTINWQTKWKPQTVKSWRNLPTECMKAWS